MHLLVEGAEHEIKEKLKPLLDRAEVINLIIAFFYVCRFLELAVNRRRN